MRDFLQISIHQVALKSAKNSINLACHAVSTTVSIWKSCFVNAKLLGQGKSDDSKRIWEDSGKYPVSRKTG